MADTIRNSNDARSDSSPSGRVLGIGMALTAILLLADQVTKMLVLRHFQLGESVPLIPGFFQLTFILNQGAAWGILAGKGWLLLTISLAVLVFIAVRMRALCENWTERYLALFMIIAGILGNTIDRIWRKAVVDFLDFFIRGYHWPAFNVADSAITVGVTIYVLSVLCRPQAPTPADAGTATPKA